MLRACSHNQTDYPTTQPTGRRAHRARRLSPADCHRLHAPVAGRVARVARHGSRYMASIWVAVHSALDVMLENERWVMGWWG
jgi:phosphatidylserine decarboxylase